MKVSLERYFTFFFILLFVGGSAVVSPQTLLALTLNSVKVEGDIPLNPDDPFWSRYGPTHNAHQVIDLTPQMITNPMWPDPATKWISVKAVKNSSEIALRLEWIDSTRNDIMVQSQQYKDQAAIMFPVDQSGDEPPFTMGGEGQPVNIWQWKATWDKEGAGLSGNSGMQDMEDQYHHMAMGSGSYYMYEPNGTLFMSKKPADSLHERQTYIDRGMGKNEGVYNPGRATGNMLSDASIRRSPVEDLNAEGFSTLTTQADQNVDGKGNWHNHRWAVVIKRKLRTEDPHDTQFKEDKTPIAFAVWNGNNKERNGQKAVSVFHTLKY